MLFLDSVLEKQREEERLRKEMDGVEVKGFREAVAARENAAKPPPVAASATPSINSNKGKAVAPAVVKKDAKKSLKGVLVKKKPKAVTAASSATVTPKARTSKPVETEENPTPKDAKKARPKPDDGEDQPDAKRPRVSDKT